jgi:hypothetical protein
LWVILHLMSVLRFFISKTTFFYFENLIFFQFELLLALIFVLCFISTFYIFKKHILKFYNWEFLYQKSLESLIIFTDYSDFHSGSLFLLVMNSYLNRALSFEILLIIGHKLLEHIYVCMPLPGFLGFW